MNLIEKWKNRETKKKLREENIRLKEQIERRESVKRPSVCTSERNVQAIRSEYNSPIGGSVYVPESVIKMTIAKELLDYIKPFIEYDFHENPNGGKVYTGTLYVGTGDRKRESNNEM